MRKWQNSEGTFHMKNLLSVSGPLMLSGSNHCFLEQCFQQFWRSQGCHGFKLVYNNKLISEHLGKLQILTLIVSIIQVLLCTFGCLYLTRMACRGQPLVFNCKSCNARTLALRSDTLYAVQCSRVGFCHRGKQKLSPMCTHQNQMKDWGMECRPMGDLTDPKSIWQERQLMQQ